jgi:hypothetical protein
LVLNGLVPKGSCAIKVHLRNTDPERLLNEIHFEILLSTSFSTARLFTIEPREWDFGKPAFRIMLAMGVRRGWTWR